MNTRDKEILQHILKYCNEIDQAVDCFGDDETEFISNAVYRNAVSMPIQ